MARTISIVLLLGLLTWNSEANQRVSTRQIQCGAAAIQKCSDEFRLCNAFVDGTEECGHCQLGFVEFAESNASSSNGPAPCVEIANLDAQRFTEIYDPYYSDTSKDASELTSYLKQSARLISQSNVLNPNSAFTLGLTSYSADSELEFQQRSGYFYVNVTGTSDEIPTFVPPTVAAADIPKSIDWLQSGAVTPVKEQFRCGCSWAIGVGGAIEGAVFLVDRSNDSVSFQQFISCNKRNLGCDGGSMTIAALYAAGNWYGGVTAFTDYPFVNRDGLTTESCELANESPPQLSMKVANPVTVVGFDAAVGFDERVETFKLALMQKPISIVMKSSCNMFSNYFSGILTDDGQCACSEAVCYDHSVLMVGYDDAGETPYFKFKNSWGTQWGEDGYFRVAQLERGQFGLFGILGEGLMVDADRTKDAKRIDMDDSDDDGIIFPIWSVVTMAVASSLICFCCVYVLCACWLKKRQI